MLKDNYSEMCMEESVESKGFPSSDDVKEKY